jgi:hypothetical protein
MYCGDRPAAFAAGLFFVAGSSIENVPGLQLEANSLQLKKANSYQLTAS